MKITMYRASGTPINPDHQIAYLQELNKEMDKLENTIGKCSLANAEVFQGSLEIVHRQLTEQYPNKVQVPFPTNHKQMIELCNTYGSVAFAVEENKLVLYILDA